MRKYAIMDGFNVMSFTESTEEDFKIEGHVIIDVTDIEPQPSIGWTYWNGTWSPSPIWIHTSQGIEHGFISGIQLHEDPNIIDAEVVEDTKAIEDTPTEKK